MKKSFLNTCPIFGEHHMVKRGNVNISFWEIGLTWILLLIFSSAEAQIIITANITQPTCFNHLAAAGGTTGNGVIIASASGGTPPYSYLLESNSAQQTNGYFPGLSAGTYSIELWMRWDKQKRLSSF